MFAAFHHPTLYSFLSRSLRCILTGIAPWAILAALLTAPMLAPPFVYAQSNVENRSFMLTIPAGSLEDALNALANQADVALTFTPDQVSGRHVEGLQGSYTVNSAMEILLKESGLGFHQNQDGSYYLASLKDDVVTIPPLKVVGKSISETGVETIPVDRIQRNLGTDMADIFKDEPSVVVGGGSRNAQRIYVRGIEASNLNVTIDGAKQGRNLFQHRGNGGVGGMDPGLLKSVEVATGPSSLNGAGSLGGSIRMETVDAQDMLAEGRHAGAKLSVGAFSADDGYTGSASGYGAYDGIGMLASVSGTNTYDYRDGAGDHVHGSAGQDRSYFLKFSMLDKANHQLRISAQQNENSGLYRWGGGDMGYDDSAELSYQESMRQTFTLDHRYHAADNPWVDWHFNAYLNDLTLDNIDADTETESQGLGADLNNTTRFKLGVTQHKVTIGGDYYAEEGVQESSGVQVGTDNEVGNLGVYLQEQMEIGPVMLTLGARWDDYDTDFGPETVSGDELSPSAGLEVALGFGFKAFAGYGESARTTGIIPIQWMSNIDDLPTFNQQEGVDSYGKDFEPETSTQYEGGLGFGREGLILDNDHLDIKVTYFETEIENLIVAIGGRGGSALTGFYNDDPVTSKGWEARAIWQIGGFKTSLGYTDGRTEDKDGNLISVSQRKAAATGDRFIWDNFLRIQNGFGVGYTLEAVGGIHEDDIERSGYVLHHVQAQWQSVIPNLDVTLAVRNLFDHYYSAQTSIERNDVAVYEPGRDVRVGISYRF